MCCFGETRTEKRWLRTLWAIALIGIQGSSAAQMTVYGDDEDYDYDTREGLEFGLRCGNARLIDENEVVRLIDHAHAHPPLQALRDVPLSGDRAKLCTQRGVWRGRRHG